MSPARETKAGGRRVQRRTVESWAEFVDIIQAWDGFRNWAFRGQGDAAWPLRSSLSRHIEVAKVCPAAWPEQEERIRRIFERKCHLHVVDPPTDDELEWLALMQHHGAPTRLLDFTWSPYVAAFFALERTTHAAAVWAINLPLLWETRSPDRLDIGRADPRDREAFRQFYLPNTRAFVWQGDPFRMPQRVIAQSGTFLVSGHLGLTVEGILELYKGSGPLLIKFELNTAAMRAEAMASLYSMNITQATLFPGLDGLARSMAYEFEYSWQVDPTTNAPRESLKNPGHLPPYLANDPSTGSAATRRGRPSRPR